MSYVYVAVWIFVIPVTNLKLIQLDMVVILADLSLPLANVIKVISAKFILHLIMCLILWATAPLSIH